MIKERRLEEISALQRLYMPILMTDLHQVLYETRFLIPSYVDKMMWYSLQALGKVVAVGVRGGGREPRIVQNAWLKAT